MPGGGNPLHYHKTYSETFTAIDGELGLKLGNKETKILKPGETYTVEPLALHSFFNPIDREIKFGIKVTPGNENFENMLRIAYGLTTDGLTNKKGIPKSLTHLSVILCLGDTNLPGLFSYIFPFFQWLANKAKTNGEEQKLLDKYCN